jgi:nucleoside-diphosphate-sugar epimerase
MKILFIGGTGNISSYCVELAVSQGHEVYVLNRGLREHSFDKRVLPLCCDIRNADEVRGKLSGMTFDVVADFISFVPSHVENDIELFTGRCKQFIFISTATVYNKPPVNFPVTESTPLKNPYWKYSRDKILCEEIFMNAFRNDNFPVTIIRPSHTYGQTMIPSVIGHGDYTEMARIKAGKKLIVQGDGQTLWTLTHSSDFAKGFLGLCGNDLAIGESFHITSDEHLTWDAIMQIKAQSIGCTANIVHIPSDFINAIDPETGAGLLGDKQYNAIFDNSKLLRFVPSFRAEISFRKGILASLEYFHKNPEICVENAETSALMDRILGKYESAFS